MNVQEIRERWSKATRGPWVADMRPVATECGECGEYAYEVPGVIRRKSDGCGIVDVQESEKQNENAAAIAAAPTDIAWLLAEVERLRCCGTCGNWEQFDEFGSEKIHNCIANKKLTWRERFDKCDKWQGVRKNG